MSKKILKIMTVMSVIALIFTLGFLRGVMSIESKIMIDTELYDIINPDIESLKNAIASTQYIEEAAVPVQENYMLYELHGIDSLESGIFTETDSYIESLAINDLYEEDNIEPLITDDLIEDMFEEEIKEANNISKETYEEAAEERIRIFMEFIEGRRKTSMGWHINDIAIPAGEPNRRNYTVYTFFDSNKDGLPELHVRGGRYFHIYTIEDGEIVLWKYLHRHTTMLANGLFLLYRHVGGNESFVIFYLDYHGEEVFVNYFGRLTLQDDGRLYDVYEYGDVELSKEVWEAIRDWYYTRIIDWTVLYESS
jgi:hypothetical protein